MIADFWVLDTIYATSLILPKMIKISSAKKLLFHTRHFWFQPVTATILNSTNLCMLDFNGLQLPFFSKPSWPSTLVCATKTRAGDAPQKNESVLNPPFILLPSGYLTGWWFGTFFNFPYIYIYIHILGNINNSNWLIFFRGVEITNQLT